MSSVQFDKLAKVSTNSNIKKELCWQLRVLYQLMELFVCDVSLSRFVSFKLVGDQATLMRSKLRVCDK